MLLQKLQGCVQEFDNFCQGYLHVGKLPIEIIKARLTFVKACIFQLEETEATYTFKDTNEEIQYFKTEQPKLMLYVYYYSKLLQIEARKPFGDKEYYKNAFDGLKNDSLHIIDDIEYYRVDETSNDLAWFVRNSKKREIIAIIKSYEMLERYLQVNEDHVERNIASEGQTLEWTESKIDYAEFINSCHIKGCFNNGKASLQDIHDKMSKEWNVAIDDIHRYTYELYRRKDPGKFSLECHKSLNEKKKMLIEKQFGKGK